MKTKIYKLLALILLQCLFITPLLAQTSLAKEWDARFGGSADEGLAQGGVKQTPDGGYIIVGYSLSGLSGDKTQTSLGSYDYWAVKTDANGTKKWDYCYGTSSEDGIGRGIAIDYDGGYILVGYSFGGIEYDKSESSRGFNDYWIIKIDSNGIKKWDKTFGGDNCEICTVPLKTLDSGYAFGGYSCSSASGDKSQSSRGSSIDYWLVKTDINRNKQWDVDFGGTDDDRMIAMQQTSDSGYIIGGISISGQSGDKTENSRGGNDFWIVKTDAHGVKQWDKTLGGSGDDLLSSLSQTSDGGYIIGGQSNSGISGDKTQASQGGNDYWIVKLDANGLKQWDKCYGGSGSDVLSTIQLSSDGGYILGGASNSPISGDKTQNSWDVISDYWILKIDANGIKQWDVDFGGLNNDGLYSLQQLPDNSFILGGYSYSDIGGDKTQSSRGGSDYWIIKISCEAPQLFYRDADHDGFGNLLVL